MRSVLMTPWQATPRFLRLGLLLVVAACLLHGARIVTSPGLTAQWPTFVFYYGGALGAVWALVLSRFVLVARDRIQLLLPGNRFLMPASITFHGLCGLAPAIALGLVAHASLTATALILLVCMAGGLTVALLPAYVAAVAGFLPLIGASLSGYMRHHTLTATQADVMLLVALGVLGSICMLRWRAVSHSDPSGSRPAQAALILVIQRQTGWRGATAGYVSLKHAGPASMSRALHIALGGLYLPMRPAGHVRRWLPMGLLILLMAVLVKMASGADLPMLMSPANMALAVCYAALVLTVASTFGVVRVVQQRWRKQNAELALLALLPGLGTPEAARRKVLRACLAGPLTLHAAILAAVWLAAALAAMPTMTVILISVVIPGCSVIMVGSVLATLGGRRLPDWAMVTLMLVFLALTNACLLPVAVSHPAGAVSTAYLAVPLAGWVLLGVVMLWLGFRGWTGFQKRPHVFLPDDRARFS